MKPAPVTAVVSKKPQPHTGDGAYNPLAGTTMFRQVDTGSLGKGRKPQPWTKPLFWHSGQTQ